MWRSAEGVQRETERHRGGAEGAWWVQRGVVGHRGMQRGHGWVQRGNRKAQGGAEGMFVLG